MNLVNILTGRDPLKRAFVTLEDGMDNVLNEEFMLPPEPAGPGPGETGDEDYGDLDPASGDFADTPVLQGSPDSVDERFTVHTQSRLAGYAAFDAARLRANEELGRIGDALAAIVSSHHIGREFLNDCYADIHRSNELELANAEHQAENRRLAERVDKLERLRGRYDQLVDALKRREARLSQEGEALRDELATLKLQSVESRAALARHESLSGELQASLSAKTSEAERFMRDAEMLRERIVGLTVDLDLAQKKQGEFRRRVEELTSVHASDSARLTEVMARLANEENESNRLQKLNDALEARLVEASDTIAQLNGEAADREKRHLSEVQSAKAEAQALGARLQHASSEHREAVAEVSTLRTRLSELDAEKHILDKKYAALATELENERRMNAAPAMADAAAQEKNRRQIDQMRGEIAQLQATVGQLRQYERLYAAAKARSRANTDVASGFKIANGKIVPEFEPAPAPTFARTA